MSFSSDSEFIDQFQDGIAYVPFKSKHDKIYIFKIKLKKSELAHNAFRRDSDPHRYIHFSILYNKTRPKVNRIPSRFLGISYNKQIIYLETYEVEHEIDNFYYSPDFYFEFMPTGFIKPNRKPTSFKGWI